MSSNERNERQQPCSDPKPIPKEPSLTIDNTAQYASFVSQRSSSIDTYGSNSPTDDANDYFSERAAQEGKESGASASVLNDPKENTSAAGDGSVSASEESGARPKHWLCNDEAMPATMLHPSHQSTPLNKDQYLPTAGEGGEGGAAATEAGEGRLSDNEDSRPRMELFMSGDLQTPITGFETMEARSKFTVYKIHIQKTTSEEDEEPIGWFIFRRYSDFLHLNERLRHLFPGFRLSLPPKRWFRDNFDPNFLEDRMLGLQAFLDNITGHKDICNSEPVRAFFCTDEPPGPHDTLEESRALCDTLEESIYTLRQDLQDKDVELALLKEEVALYKSQVEILSNQLKAVTGCAPSMGMNKASVTSPSSTTPEESSGSNRSSLAECDAAASAASVAEEDKSQTQDAQSPQ
ncbi:hypothetical protein ACOMHN_025159 [Nucella lapillus]